MIPKEGATTLAERFGVTGQQIQEAAVLLREGKLVAFPTETVYGLGANALDAAAVSRIFDAKGRPHTSPHIVHVSSIEMARELAEQWPDTAQQLAERFWPGPLTLVVKKRPSIPNIVTAGLPTVGLRMPAHPVALALLGEAGVPVAAPSANRFTQLSPTTAEHVRRGLGQRVAYVLDGGPCAVGIESTVLSVVEEPPVILRPGGVSRSAIEAVIGPVARHAQSTDGAHPSPGMHPQHYSPRTPLIVVSDGAIPDTGRGAYLQLCNQPAHDATVIAMPADPGEYAARLYAVLHELDDQGYDWIAVDTPEEAPEWEGVLDRLRRASTR
jgi:L-threonylcarbamoyladenylate synthase